MKVTIKRYSGYATVSYNGKGEVKCVTYGPLFERRLKRAVKRLKNNYKAVKKLRQEEDRWISE